MKIALCQMNSTVGDVVGNTSKILEMIEEAHECGADWAVFPELALSGYPPQDLLLKPCLIESCWSKLQEIAVAVPGGMRVAIGLPTINKTGKGRHLHNSLAVCADGQVQSVSHKRLLPTYDVFDEARYFEPGGIQPVFEGVALTVCEDIWCHPRTGLKDRYKVQPVDDAMKQGAEWILNASASPYAAEKPTLRLGLICDVARESNTPVVYCNQVGGNDELIFDGRSCVVSAKGEVIFHAPAFVEGVFFASIDGNQPCAIETSELMKDIHDALVLGLRDYVHKCGFKKVCVGLSGGIDSALTAALAVSSLGAENVMGVAMPSRYSSYHSKEDAFALAESLGIVCKALPIEPAHRAYEEMLQPFIGTADGLPSLAEENIQARARGVAMMAISNATGTLLLTTGNKSELAVGYCTLYGDMCGGLNILGDLSKTRVYALARWINNSPSSTLRRSGIAIPIPWRTIEKPPSAELRPGQLDQDSLPPYNELDDILLRYVEREQHAHQIVAAGYDAELVARVIGLIERSEHKRRQASPSLRVTARAFGMGRRVPLAMRLHV